MFQIKIIKRHLFSFLGVLFFTLVCTSQEIDTEQPKGDFAYFVKAKVDGKEVFFNTENYIDGRAGKLMEDLFQGVIRGENPDPGPNLGILEAMTITITDTEPITEGVYTNVEQFKYGFKGVTLGYINTDQGYMFVTNPNEPDSYLRITKLNTQFIQGVFHGTVFDIISEKTLSITDGEFYVPRLH